MGRGDDSSAPLPAARRDPLRREIARQTNEPNARRQEIRKEKKLLASVEEEALAIEKRTKGSLARYYESQSGLQYIKTGYSDSPEPDAIVKESVREQRSLFSTYLLEDLLEGIDDPYLQDKLESILREHEKDLTVLRVASRGSGGRKELHIEPRVFDRFLNRVKRELLLYRIAEEEAKRYAQRD